jgi:hypothetical protein
MLIDIFPNENLDEACMATFKETGPRQDIRAIRLHLDDGPCWCAVTGWSENGPVSAQYTPIEESGDGPARLVTGGDCGLRLVRLVGPQGPAPAWNLADAQQWGEGFLICTPETEVVPV